RRTPTLALAILISALAPSANAALSIVGQVVDTNGKPLPQVQVIFDRAESARGASVVTVFTDAEGQFTFPGAFDDAGDIASLVSARALGFEQRERLPASANAASLELTFVMQAVANQVEVAPASA